MINPNIPLSSIPIFMPFKENSIRLPNKNFILYPYVHKYLYNCNIIKNLYVISKSDKVKDYVINYDTNVQFIKEDEKSNSDLEACYYAAKELGYEWFVLLPLTQPYRSDDIIIKLLSLDYENSNFDFITTYQIIKNRDIFYIKEGIIKYTFENESYERKGCLCEDKKMIDGSAYLIRTSFLDKIIKMNGSINHNFWNGNFYAIKHDIDFFIDIDDKEDLDKYYKLIEKNNE